MVLDTEPVMYMLGRVKTMVEPGDKRLAGVNPKVRVPMVVTPGTLSVVTDATEAAAAPNCPPTARVPAALDLEVTTPPVTAAKFAPVRACTVKLVALAVFEAILHAWPAVITRAVAVVARSALAMVQTIDVYPGADGGVTPGQTTLG